MRLRVLGPESLAPGETGLVRLHLPVALPLLPGDRFVLRETGRDETVGGGEVLDVAPVLPASRARPDRAVDRVVAERGWVDADELELLTGERRPPTVGRWVADRRRRRARRRPTLAERLDAAGPLGLELATLDERERAVLATLDDVVVDGANARRGRPRPIRSADHPAVAALAAGGLAPPSPGRASAGPSCASWPAGACWSSGTGCGSTPTPSPRPASWRPRLLAERPGRLHRRRVPRGRRDHPQARRAAARRARRPGRHPPPGRPAHRRPPAAAPAILRSLSSRWRGPGGSESVRRTRAGRRRSSWLRPPQMP